MLTSSQSSHPIASPLVTMIVLCYNQARFVVETLESVKAQTYKNTELIIVDDCSTDDSVAVIDRWLQENKIQGNFIRHQQNQGICKSLNEALSLTTGKYISMIASDDIWLPDKIERQVAIMESQLESVGVLYSDAFQIDESSHPLPVMFIAAHRPLPKMPQGQIFETLIEGNFIPGMTTLIRRSCYHKVGAYDENLPWEDWDMWMRIARCYNFLCSPLPSAKYRAHEHSYSHSDPVRMVRQCIRIGLKQIALEDLTDDQKSKLARQLLNWSEFLYSQNDPEFPDFLLAILQATGHKRAQWMYRFAKLRVSFQNWQRAKSCRQILLDLRGRLFRLQ